MKKRLLYYDLVKYLNHKNALLITGMRQVGKTTLMRQIFEEVKESKLWFDFDNPLDQKVFEVKLTGTRQDISKLSALSSELGISQTFVVSKNSREKMDFYRQ